MNVPAQMQVCSSAALAVSTAPTPEPGLERAGRSSLLSESLGPDAAPGHRLRRAAMRLTDRDRRLVNLVFETRALRAEQVQVALFTAGGQSRCQRRLTLLVQHHYLDRLPRRSVNEPAVYLLTRQSTNGNRLLRQEWGETVFRRRMGRLGPLEHLLAVNDVRVRVQRACMELGWSLRLWQGPEDLAPLLTGSRLIPDAYFQVQRPGKDRTLTAGFFLELERASKAKSTKVLASKLERYAQLYYSGRYQEAFGTRALQLLVVYDADRQDTTLRRIETGVDTAQRLGVTFARFVGLDQLKGAAPTATLGDALWHKPDAQERVALISR